MELSQADLKQMIEDSECPIIADWDDIVDNYKGLVFEINDHGNVTLWNHFKNGNNRELSSFI